MESGHFITALHEAHPLTHSVAILEVDLFSQNLFALPAKGCRRDSDAVCEGDDHKHWEGKFSKGIGG